MPIADAYQLVSELDLDLVEDGPQTVRIYDHGRMAYAAEAARREAARAARWLRRTHRSDRLSPVRTCAGRRQIRLLPAVACAWR